MKIAVYGSGAGSIGDKVRELAEETGRQIASRGHVLITGGCYGLPYDAVLGANQANGEVIGFSPGVNEKDHTERFGFTTEGFSSLVYIPEDYPYKDTKGACLKLRNIFSVTESDAAVIIGGRCGTLNEFTIAYDLGKNIGVLQGTGGIAVIIDMLAESFKKPTGSRIVYSPSPEELITKLEEL